MSKSSATLITDAVPGLIRPISKADNAAIAAVIRAVMTEFGCTAEGFAIHDPEVDTMFEAYGQPQSAYFLAEHGGVVAGGSGIAPLKGGDADTCELQKNYATAECCLKNAWKRRKHLVTGAAISRPSNTWRLPGRFTCAPVSSRLINQWGLRGITAATAGI
jgi:hypothetical protein